MLLEDWEGAHTRRAHATAHAWQISVLTPLGGNHSTSGLPASPFIRTHTGRWGNPVHRQENDESPKKAKFSILAYHLRMTGNTVTPTPPLPEPPQGPRPCPLQSPEDTHCLSQRGSALPRQWLLTYCPYSQLGHSLACISNSNTGSGTQPALN